MIDKNGKNIRPMDVTPDTYACPVGEELLFHVKIENVLFDERTGERKSHPRIQKFGRKAFNSIVLSALKKSGYTVEILHDPDEWVKTHSDALSPNGRVRTPISSAERAKLKAELLQEIREELKAEAGADAEKPAPSKGRNKKVSDPEEPADPMEP